MHNSGPVQVCHHVGEKEAGSDQFIGRRLITDALDWRAKFQAEETFCLVKSSLDRQEPWAKLSYKQIGDAVNWTAWWIERTLGTSGTNETLAYMANNDIRYIIFCLAAIKAGYQTLLSSPRNSVQGHLHLLNTLRCKNFFWSKERYVRSIPIKDVMPELHMWEIPPLSNMLRETSRPFPNNLSYAKNIDDVAIIIHSSGSTGLPKPVRMTHGYLAALDAHTLLPSSPDGRRAIMSTINVDDRTFCMNPFFHLSGFFAFGEAIFRQLEFAICPDKSPSTDQIADMVLDVKATRATFPPSVVEDLIRSERGVMAVKQLRTLFFGGAPLSKDIGDRISKLTKLITGYGATEMGNIANMIPKDREDWNCIEWHPDMGVKMREVEDSDLYELVHVRKESRLFQCTFHAFPELQEYQSNDLFSKHPTKLGLWIFQGRRDDIIVLDNGEKFNPTLMEHTITAHPLVKQSVIFGHRRFQSGVIVEPDLTVWSGDEPVSVFIDKIWPAVMDANKIGPTHASLMKSMILVASRMKPFAITIKGTVHRKKVLEDYRNEIERLYNSDDVEELGILPTDATFEQVKVYVKMAIMAITEKSEISDSTDIFEYGTDSLQTIRLAKSFQGAIRTTYPDKDYHAITAQKLYATRTVEQISVALHSLLTGGHFSDVTLETDQARAERLESLVTKYTADLPAKSPPLPAIPSRYCVILTGSTGSLGSYILHQLIQDDNVEKVFCLNRSEDAKSRQEQSFKFRGLNPAAGLSKATFWKARYGEEKFGLSEDQYQELISSVSVVIHSAWKVDFNHAVSTFETDHIRGVRRFVDFSIASRNLGYICFISSISVVARWKDTDGAGVPESPMGNPNSTTQSGYGESKYVAERILEEGAFRSGVPASILRVGQVSGPTTKQGEWNRAEWFPTILLSSKAMGKVPNSLGQMAVDWIPVDVLARITMELIKSSLATRDQQRLAVFHLANPNIVPWTALLPTIRQRIKADEVSFTAWTDTLAMIEPSKEAVANVPALKLLDFFKGMVASTGKFPTMRLEKTMEASESLRDLKGIDTALMNQYLSQWGI